MNIRNGMAAVCVAAPIAVASAQPVATLALRDGDESGMDLPFNTVEFVLTNLAGTGLTRMSLTVGNPVWNFDQVYEDREVFFGGTGLEMALLIEGDRVQDGAGPDAFTYDFTGFGGGASFRGQFDIDNDDGTFQADSRTILFNNGPAPNAVLTLSFADGSVVLFTLPDGPAGAAEYTFTIPTPGALTLSALACAFWFRRARR
ncbi:MAG: hypothetical protein ACT4PL_03465 [Phycisphaerales bacterium]